MTDFAGRHFVVTGGGSGIGLAIVERLFTAGAAITIMGRSTERLAAVVDKMPTVRSVPVDVCDEASVGEAFQTAAAFAPIDVLINNAGAAHSAPFGKMTLHDWRGMLDVNATGAFLCCQAALPGLLEADHGRVVNVASTAGVKGYAYVSAYVAAKHALIGLTRALALEYARTSLTINAVCPGFTRTQIVEDSVHNIMSKTGRTQEEALNSLTANNPQGRLIDPDEVASAVSWLCLPESQSITGQAIFVAGGEVG